MMEVSTGTSERGGDGKISSHGKPRGWNKHGGAPGGEYQVFLSFRGTDTPYGFTGSIYHALVDASIRVFRYEDELRVREVIGRELLRAINNSILYKLIFSRIYATNKWRLLELF